MGHQCLQKTALRCAGCADWSEFVLDQSENRTKLLLLCSINLNDLNAIQWSTFQTPSCVFGEVFFLFDVFSCLFSFRTSEETLGSSFIGFFHFPLLKPKPFSAPLVCQCSHTSENPLSLNMIKFYIYKYEKGKVYMKDKREVYGISEKPWVCIQDSAQCLTAWISKEVPN